MQRWLCNVLGFELIGSLRPSNQAQSELLSDSFERGVTKTQVNCFEVKSLPDFKVTQCALSSCFAVIQLNARLCTDDVVMTPDVPKTVKRQVWRQFETEHGASLQGVKVVYDGEKICFANGNPFGEKKEVSSIFLTKRGNSDFLAVHRQSPRRRI